MSVKFTSVPTKNLAASISASATAFRLSNITGWDGVDLTSANFGTQAYGVFRNAARTRIELFEFDPATIADDEITIVLRGLQFDGDLTTEVSGNKYAWAKGDTFVDLGTDTPQLFQYLKEYIDDGLNAGAADADETTKGLFEEATQAEADAGTATGATGAQLAVPPDKLRGRLINDYVADTGSADAYAIAPSPAITAYATGQMFTFKAANANTGASTLNVNGVGTKAIKTGAGVALGAGQIAAGQVVTVVYDGTDFLAVSELNAIAPVVRTYLNAASPATWTKPAGLKYIVVEVQAAGGNGSSATSSDFCAGGGGGGGYAKKTIAAASLGATETVTIGAVGASSSFGSHCSATSGSSAGPNSTAGAAGGTATGGDININGQGGDDGEGNQTSNADTSGSGGDSFLGLGGRAIRSGDGVAGTGYGGGGGGASASSSDDLAGGAGAPAIVIVTEHY